jgi:uncharacterized membrane protein
MKRQATLFLATLIVGVAVWFIPLHIVRYVLGFGLLWILPGLSWGLLLPRHTLGRAGRLAVGLGLNYAITPLATLLLTYLPGPLTRASLIAAMVAIAGLPIVVPALMHSRHKRTNPLEIHPVDGLDVPTPTHRTSLLDRRHPLWKDGWVWLLIALVLAAGLRVTKPSSSSMTKGHPNSRWQWPAGG